MHSCEANSNGWWLGRQPFRSRRCRHFWSFPAPRPVSVLP